MVRAIDASPDGKYVRVTQMVKPFSYDVPVSSFGSDRRNVGRRRQGAREADRSRRSTSACRTTRSRRADPPAAGGGRGGANQQGKREMAWRADGQGLTYLEQEPAPAGGRGRRGARRPVAGAGQADAGRGDADDTGRGAPRAGAQGSPLPVARAVRRGEQEGAVREQHAHDRPALLARHEDDLLQRARRAEHRRLRRQPRRAGAAVHARALSLRRRLRQPRIARRHCAAAAVAAAAARGGGRGGGGGGTGPVLLSADGASVYLQGTAYDKNPNDVGPKTFIDRVAIKTGEKKRIYESENDDVYERVVVGARYRRRRASSSRARGRRRCRSSSWCRTARARS